jgi:hypothetical protein
MAHLHLGACLALVATGAATAAGLPPGVRYMDFHGYRGCPVIENASARVILGPQVGGMVLSYSWKGSEAIPLNPAQAGWTYQPDQKVIDPYGGRFDIGPETTCPGHPVLFYGAWTAEASGPRAVRMTSQPDEKTGVQLIRDFRLAPIGSHLRCTQTIRNVSHQVQPWCHWSRTFGLGNGICVVPLNPRSRFPRGYITYGPGNVMNYTPEPHDNVRVREGYLEIRGNPPFAKFGLDAEAGWFAYLMPNDTVFVKRFPVYPDRVYSEMAAITVSIFYWPPLDVLAKHEEGGLPIPFCELEPIGPRNAIQPGKTASFSEDWWLLPFSFPKDREADLKAVAERVGREAR